MTSSSREHDEGLGLIELIVAMVVAGIVIAGIATVLTRSWQTQEEVLSVSEATTRGQVMSAAIERAVRNGVYVQVSESGRVLRVSTTLTGSLECQGFRLSDNSDGTAQFSMSSSTLADPLTWPEWQAGVASQGSVPYFEKSALGVVSYEFELETESAPVRFSGEASPRSIQEGDNDTCW